MPVSYIRNKIEVNLQIFQDQTGRKAQRLTATNSTLVLSTNKKDHERLLKVSEKLMTEQINQLGLSIQRGYESLDNQVLVPKTFLKQLMSNQDDKD